MGSGEEGDPGPAGRPGQGAAVADGGVVGSGLGGSGGLAAATDAHDASEWSAARPGWGVAEELLFHGWLPGELGLQLGERRALLVQALVFSLVHTRFNLPLPLLLGLLGGLLLLGLALGLQPKADGGLLWGAIGLHGGLVGGWFLLQQLVELMVELSSSAPALLMGPANPIGGLAGWLGLAWLVLAMRNPPGFGSRINQIPKN